MARLDEIRARLSAATPAPWCGPSHWDLTREQQEIWGGPLVRIACIPTGEDDESTAGARADANLIANAPTDLAYLLGEVGRLTAALTEFAQHDVVCEAVCQGNPYPAVNDPGCSCGLYAAYCGQST